jgi:hypothetical protein
MRLKYRKKIIEASSDPSFRGDKSNNPENVSGFSFLCHMLWFLHFVLMLLLLFWNIRMPPLVK